MGHRIRSLMDFRIYRRVFSHLRSSQRNVYLTGFTLFLSLVLTRVFAIILDLIETQTAYAALKQQVRSLRHNHSVGLGRFVFLNPPCFRLLTITDPAMIL